MEEILRVAIGVLLPALALFVFSWAESGKGGKNEEYLDAVHVSPSSRLRAEADRIDQVDKDIDFIQSVLEECER